MKILLLSRANISLDGNLCSSSFLIKTIIELINTAFFIDVSVPLRTRLEELPDLFGFPSSPLRFVALWLHKRMAPELFHPLCLFVPGKFIHFMTWISCKKANPTLVGGCLLILEHLGRILPKLYVKDLNQRTWDKVNQKMLDDTVCDNLCGCL